MIKRDGTIWYWCGKHKYNNKGVIANGMYVTHKQDDHKAWKNGASTAVLILISVKPTALASVANDLSALKLSLSKSLQAGLVTTAGISEYQFKNLR